MTTQRLIRVNTLYNKIKNVLNLKSIVSIAIAVFFIYIQNDILKSFIFISCLLVHELAHIFSAKVAEISISSFYLLPFGARIQTEEVPYCNSAVFMYLMGPVSNLIFAVLIIILSCFYYIPSYDFFIFYNILLAIINLIPIIPLDASKALLIFLAKKTSQIKAVDMVVSISKVIALIVLFLGIYIYFFAEKNLFLISLSLFFMYMIKREESSLTYQYMLNIKDTLENA